MTPNKKPVETQAYVVQTWIEHLLKQDDKAQALDVLSTVKSSIQLLEEKLDTYEKELNQHETC